MVDKKSSQKERVSIFIDGSNLYHSLRVLGIKRIDFNEFTKLLAGDNEIKRIFYYTARMDRAFDEQRFLKHQNFLRNYF